MVDLNYAYNFCNINNNFNKGKTFTFINDVDKYRECITETLDSLCVVKNKNDVDDPGSIIINEKYVLNLYQADAAYLLIGDDANAKFSFICECGYDLNDFKQFISNSLCDPNWIEHLDVFVNLMSNI